MAAPRPSDHGGAARHRPHAAGRHGVSLRLGHSRAHHGIDLLHGPRHRQASASHERLVLDRHPHARHRTRHGAKLRVRALGRRGAGHHRVLRADNTAPPHVDAEGARRYARHDRVRATVHHADTDTDGAGAAVAVRRGQSRGRAVRGRGHVGRTGGADGGVAEPRTGLCMRMAGLVRHHRDGTSGGFTRRHTCRHAAVEFRHTRCDLHDGVRDGRRRHHRRLCAVACARTGHSGWVAGDADGIGLAQSHRHLVHRDGAGACPAIRRDWRLWPKQQRRILPYAS